MIIVPASSQRNDDLSYYPGHGSAYKYVNALPFKIAATMLFPFNFMHLKKNRGPEVVAINKIYKNKIYHL